MIVFTLAGVGVDASSVRATDDARVLVMGEPPRPGFVDAMRIQLAGQAEVQHVPALIGETARERVDAAVQAVGRTQAQLAVWLVIESEDALLYMVGPREGRAVVEIVHVPLEDGPDFDRVLALKVADVLETLLAAAGGDGLVATVAPAPPAEPEPEPPPEPAWKLSLMGGGSLSTPSGTVPWRFGMVVVVRAVLDLGGLALEPAIGVVVPSASRLADGPRGQVDLTEVAPMLGFGVSWPVGPVVLGAEARARLRWVFAEGVSPGGRMGAETAVVPEGALLAVGRVPIAGGLAIDLSVGVGAAPFRQRFLVNERPLGDLGVVHGVAELGLSLTR